MTSRTTALLALALLAACGLRPYTLDSASGDASATATSSASATIDATTTTGAAPTTAATTTGGPGAGVWRGLYRREYLEWVWLDDDLFLDCDTQQVWQLRGDGLPKICGEIDDGTGLYLHVAGILRPDGDDADALDELEITEFLANPCHLGSCEEPLGWSSCGSWSDVCGHFIECDPWIQDCPAGQKCAVFSGGEYPLNSLKCVPEAPGAGMHGDPCIAENDGLDGLDTCAKGHICWNLDPEGEGTCLAQCAGSPVDAMCPECTSCYISQSNILNLCLADCSPLLQNCPNHGPCVVSPWNHDGFMCDYDVSGREGQAFDPCEYYNGCDPGLWCAPPEHASECDPNAIGCCLPFCDLTQPACPGAGQQCLPWSDPPPACGNENLGACRLPP